MKEPLTKEYILDTNILIDDPDAFYRFEENDVGIVDVTLEELDGLKKASGDRGYGARRSIKNIEKLLSEGKTPGGGEFIILNSKEGMTADNAIIDAVAVAQDKFLRPGKVPTKKIVLVSNDIAVRVKCAHKEVEAQEYKNPKVKETFYTGYREIVLPNEDWGRIQTYYAGEEAGNYDFSPDYDYLQSLSEAPFVENEYIRVSCGNMSYVLHAKPSQKALVGISKSLHPCKISPRNVLQKMALDALMAPVDEIPLVILKGPAGCAKTFLALAAGLDGQFDRTFSKVIITRNNVLSDRELGYLKGDLEAKMDPLLAPFYDNLEIILRGDTKEDIEQINMQIEDLKSSGALEVASMAYMRGRSIANSFIIIDEVQNASSQQVLNIVTRAAKGSKVVLCGDPDQVDAPYLSRENNGLVFAADKMKGSKLCAQITFSNNESIRSPLAYEAMQRFAEGR